MVNEKLWVPIQMHTVVAAVVTVRICFSLLSDQMCDFIGRCVFVLISVSSFLVGFLCCVGICEADCVGHAGELLDHPGR